MLRVVALGLLLVPALATAAEEATAEEGPAVAVVTKEDAGLRYTIPTSWRRVPAPSDMRAAQYNLPAERAADGELVLFFFGEGQGGSVDQNLERWYAQFTQPDGSASRDAAVLTVRTVGSLRVTAVDLAGTYAPSPSMGGTVAAKPDTRMLAAVIEGAGGPWFFRAVGPTDTIAGAKDAFDAMLLSLTPHR